MTKELGRKPVDPRLQELLAQKNAAAARKSSPKGGKAKRDGSSPMEDKVPSGRMRLVGGKSGAGFR